MLPKCDERWELNLPDGTVAVARISLSRDKRLLDKFRYMIIVDIGSIADGPMHWFGMPPMYRNAEQAFDEGRKVLRHLGFVLRE